MSDRVRAMGYTPLEGSTPVIEPSFWGTPKRFEPAIFDGDNYAPLATTIPFVCKWWWRVKRWELVTDATASDGTNTASIPSQAFIETGAFYTPPTRERELAFVPIDGFPPARFFTIDNGPAAALFELLPAIAKQGSSIYPQMSLGGSINLLDGSGNEAHLTITTFNTSPPPTSSIVGHMDGLPITLYVAQTNLGSGSSSVSQFDISPIEYWPYAGTDGLPIYNTTTGAVLPGRSPQM